jgi:hypothetical protein
MRCFPEKEEWLYFKERPLRMEAALFLMASHWPPENLPMREVKLRAGYTIAWMQHLLRAGDITDDTLFRISASVLSFDNEQSSRQTI